MKYSREITNTPLSMVQPWPLISLLNVREASVLTISKNMEQMKLHYKCKRNLLINIRTNTKYLRILYMKHVIFKFNWILRKISVGLTNLNLNNY